MYIHCSHYAEGLHFSAFHFIIYIYMVVNFVVGVYRGWCIINKCLVDPLQAMQLRGHDLSIPYSLYIILGV